MPITYSKRAQVALVSLEERDRHRVESALQRLADTGLGPTTRIKAVQIPGADRLFVLRAPHSFRVIFRHAPDGAIHVEDIVRHDVLRRWGGR